MSAPETSGPKRGRPPRRPSAAPGRVLWSGEKLDPAGNIIPDENTRVVPVPGASGSDEAIEAAIENDQDETPEPVDPVRAAERAAESRAESRVAGLARDLPSGIRELPPDVVVEDIGDDDDPLDLSREDRFPPRPGSADPLAPTVAEMRANAKETDKVYQEAFAGYDTKRGKWTFTLMRDKPKMWTDARTGVTRDIEGRLGSWDEPLSEEEVAAQFGGGSYHWRPYGPDPKNPSHSVAKPRVPFKMAGDPIVPMTGPAAASDNSLVKEVMARQQADMMRKEKELDEARKFAEQQRRDLAKSQENAMQAVMDTMAKLMNPQGQQQMLLEERRLAEARAREDAAVRAKADEAAERRHRESLDAIEKRAREDREAAERRHQQSLEAAKQQHEREMARIKGENDRALELARTSEKDSGKMMSTLLEMQQRMAAENEKRTASNNELMMRQMAALGEMKEGFLLKMVDKKDVDPLDQLLKLKQVSELLGGGPVDKDGWDRAAEVLGPIAKDLGPGLIGLLQARGQQPGQPQQRFQPGTVAAVDLPPQAALPPGQRQAPRQASPATAKPKVPKRPQAPQVPRRDPPAPVMEVIPPMPAPPVGEPPTVIGAPLAAPFAPGWTAALPPAELTELQDRIKFLVLQIEEAIQHDLSADQIYAQVVEKYAAEAPDVLVAVRLVSRDQAQEMVMSLAPDDWRLKTLRGKQTLSALLERLFARSA